MTRDYISSDRLHLRRMIFQRARLLIQNFRKLVRR